MKFFVIILLSSFHAWSLACPGDDPNIPEPFCQLCSPYSKHQSQLPKSDDPNISYPARETLAEEDERNDLSISLPEHLYSKRGHILYACEYDLCSQLLSKYGHSHYRIFEQGCPCNGFAGHPVKHDSGIWSPKLCGTTNGLSYENSCDSLPYNKSKTFIETKVTAIKLQGFNL